jgi:hypothetical protein
MAEAATLKRLGAVEAACSTGLAFVVVVVELNSGRIGFGKGLNENCLYS